ncbi:TetR/AcrR family transcriptional regulator [Cryptosporangium minutisporangium]|uniref:HTH tetR-type domain-containing protein n=1 Tax=Cryptosporangium minutisporangium TaxID=113569 RepID=A0ABP6T4V8_9ACTN
MSTQPQPAEDPSAEGASPRELRRAQRLESRRREIVEVAEELFAAHGYDGTSLEKIAAGSGYSVGGIYNFFRSKDAVYAAVLDRHTTVLVERLTACVGAGGTGLDTLLSMASTAVRTLGEFPDRTRLTLGALRPDFSPDSRGHFRRILEAYAIAIRDGQGDGTVRDGDPRHLAQYVGGLVLAQTQVDPELTGDASGIPRDEFLALVRRALGTVQG